jgi:hypothetical protein
VEAIVSKWAESLCDDERWKVQQPQREKGEGMATFIPAEDEVTKLVTACIEQFHLDLKDVGATISVVIAAAQIDQKTGELKGPAVTNYGFPAPAMIRVVPSRLRVQGIGDAELVINGDLWDTLPKEQQVALIDNELTKLELRRDGEGHVKRDDYNRPLFRIRKPDWIAYGFDEVVRRHGDNSLVMKHLREEVLNEDRPMKQQLFNYG